MLKYEQIALQINAYIAEGNYQAGDKLPYTGIIIMK